MKSLYESIISKSGVGKIYSIRKWVENHLSLSSFTWALADNIDEHVSFNSDDSINVSGYEPWFFLDYDEKIPDFIQFRKAETFALAWNGVMDDWSFLPNKMQRLFLTPHMSKGCNKWLIWHKCCMPLALKNHALHSFIVLKR